MTLSDAQHHAEAIDIFESVIRMERKMKIPEVEVCYTESFSDFVHTFGFFRRFSVWSLIVIMFNGDITVIINLQVVILIYLLSSQPVHLPLISNVTILMGMLVFLL